MEYGIVASAMATGKLIVIDGADGSGKATQTRMLARRLVEDGHRVETLDFPRYRDNFFGKFIRECLDGKHGDFLSVDPRIASALYAADRYESSAKLSTWLSEGAIVVLDRYVSANMMHQGAKIEDERELSEFLTWLDEMEHGVFRIPRPHLIIHLDVPHEVRRKLVQRDTTRTSVDLAEQNEAHQKASEERARQLVAELNDWHTVICTHGDELRSPESIHEDVYHIVKTTIS